MNHPTPPSPTDLLALAVDLAEQAAGLALDYFRHAQARRKGDGSLVTEADEAADRLIVQSIRQSYPGHAILSEEGFTGYDPGPEFTWVIDPIDGTTNFARGLPVWGVSIGVLRHGAPWVAALHFPGLDERYTAMAGQGALRNGERLAVDPDAAIHDQQLLARCTRTDSRFHIETPMKVRMLGSAAYHLLCVAGGVVLAAMEARPKVWDLAAAHLVLTEAGGVARHLYTTRPPFETGAIFPLPPSPKEYAQHYHPVLAAVSEKHFGEVLKNMRSKDKE
jgi:myo-inositol-1(or 4)-monophosphatase